MIETNIILYVHVNNKVAISLQYCTTNLHCYCMHMHYAKQRFSHDRVYVRMCILAFQNKLDSNMPAQLQMSNGDRKCPK